MAAVSQECFVIRTAFCCRLLISQAYVLPVCNANIHVSRKITPSTFLLPTIKSGVNIKENTSSGTETQPQTQSSSSRVLLLAAPSKHTCTASSACVVSERYEFSGTSLQWKTRYIREGTMQYHPSKLPLVTDRSEPNFEIF